MIGSDIVGALDLPAVTRVDRRVPKKLLLENGAPTAADKRYINEGIEEFHWLATLKPSTIGVPDYRDELREYLEIAVLQLALRPDAKTGRLVELVHRAVPYPVVLLTEGASYLGLSAAHIRWSQGETGRTVLEDRVIAVEWDDSLDTGQWPAFRDALALGNQSHSNLYALYQGWVDTLLALHASRLTRTFAKPSSAAHAAERREALEECARLEARMAALRAAAERETQTPEHVEINLEIQRLKAEYAATRARL